MQTKFFTLDIVGYCELEGTPFSNTNHIEVTNPPCDVRIFQSHKHDALIEFYTDEGVLTLTTVNAQAKVEYKGKVRTWNDYDIHRVHKYIRKLTGIHARAGATVQLPNAEPPNWLQAKSQSVLSFANKLLKR